MLTAVLRQDFFYGFHPDYGYRERDRIELDV